MDESIQRLMFVRDSLNMNTKEFGLSVGMKPSAMHSLFTRGNSVSQVLALAVEHIHKYRWQWIIKGEPPKKKNNFENLDARDQAILELFHFTTKIKPDILEESVLWFLWETSTQRCSRKLVSPIDEGKMWQQENDARGLQNRVDEINKEIRKIVYRVKKDSTYTSQIYPLVLMIYYGTAAWEKIKFRSEEYEYLEKEHMTDEYKRNEKLIKGLLSELEELLAIDIDEWAEASSKRPLTPIEDIPLKFRDLFEEKDAKK